MGYHASLSNSSAVSLSSLSLFLFLCCSLSPSHSLSFLFSVSDKLDSLQTLKCNMYFYFGDLTHALTISPHLPEDNSLFFKLSHEKYSC